MLPRALMPYPPLRLAYTETWITIRAGTYRLVSDLQGMRQWLDKHHYQMFDFLVIPTKMPELTGTRIVVYTC